ncbi:pre mRNA splicing factor cwc 21, putative [Babesia ovis]|uniref:Pre mRNA splicing factor cwc 21, putative n=1 Tax=Babesia ovis TaxID=5869 RepID=A0A9W5TEQ2_BABOV|nr:pre mRNA splicing factor cwc 21, putative [Babesia ovis]
MFNGVGLTTPRGSGTNGYVQRSLANLPTMRLTKNNDQRGTITRPKMKTNPEIAQHEKIRALEVKLLELRLKKEGQMKPEELEEFISNERQRLVKLLDHDILSVSIKENQSNRLAEMKLKQNQTMEDALKLWPRKADVNTGEGGNRKDNGIDRKRHEVRSVKRDYNERTRSYSRSRSRSLDRRQKGALPRRSRSRSGRSYRSRRKGQRRHRSYSSDDSYSTGRSSISPYDSSRDGSRRSHSYRSVSASRSYSSVRSEYETPTTSRSCSRSPSRNRDRLRGSHRKDRSVRKDSYSSGGSSVSASRSRSISRRRAHKRSHSRGSIVHRGKRQYKDRSISIDNKYKSARKGRSHTRSASVSHGSDRSRRCSRGRDKYSTINGSSRYRSRSMSLSRSRSKVSSSESIERRHRSSASTDDRHKTGGTGNIHNEHGNGDDGHMTDSSMEHSDD